MTFPKFTRGPDRQSLSRRRLLGMLGGSAGAAAIGGLGFSDLAGAFSPPHPALPVIGPSDICRASAEVRPADQDVPHFGPFPDKLTPIKFAWNGNAICHAPIPLALNSGIFRKYNLDVELISYAGSTDQLLESISSGKADAAQGMVRRWLKPLEQGFDVKLIAGIHGGCVRMLASRAAGIQQPEDLRGKTVGVAEIGGVGQTMFSTLLARNGVDPDKDVQWRVFPPNLMGVAVKKGEIQAIADVDPNLWLLQKADSDLVEILNSHSGHYQGRVCCVLGVGTKLLKERRPVAAALAQSLVEAAELTARDPDAAGAAFAPYSPNATAEDLAGILKTMTYHTHPVRAALTEDIIFYAEEMKELSILKNSTDPKTFGARITADISI
ncbi:ABC transporter substrate-binding protein [Telmatospirillum siberiense]|uniref:ABC transporter substrate-binding protein n=1 Tax=Telmatospirillum siberiense TaxID=382514 RepID=A0A2N3PQ14_9PROT|nr:ABC transporter substrate-binding protein [Telmatospirillum siberiense]PKU22489.1 ABC transporter substrate-binding protein [Telmatospirillum siberiense]